MSFVTCKLYGRMGNQMFQIAATMGLAYKHGAEFLIPRYTGDPGRPADELYFNHFPEFKPSEHRIKHVTREMGHAFQRLNYFPNMQIDGYWQTEKYFEHIREEVVRWFEKALDNGRPLRPDTVGLHVRRGDYVNNPNFPVIPMTYIDQAIGYFKAQGFTKFFVSSDGIDWCKENLKHDVEFDFTDSRTPHENMWELSLCAHQIISNSTFSWWAAWLNRNSDKQVIAPAYTNWFGRNVRLDCKDVIPKTWMQIAYAN